MGKIIPMQKPVSTMKNITPGTSNKNDTNGCGGSFNQMKTPTDGGEDETIESKTVKSSTSISQHKRMAMG